jgi:hypothetical protein
MHLLVRAIGNHEPTTYSQRSPRYKSRSRYSQQGPDSLDLDPIQRPNLHLRQPHPGHAACGRLCVVEHVRPTPPQSNSHCSTARHRIVAQSNLHEAAVFLLLRPILRFSDYTLRRCVKRYCAFQITGTCTPQYSFLFTTGSFELPLTRELCLSPAMFNRLKKLHSCIYHNFQSTK